MNTTTARSLAAVALGGAALMLSACSAGDEGSDSPAGFDTDEVEAQIEDQVADPGESYAEITFRGATVRYDAVESFGCYLTEDGGSMGALDFTGVAEDGSEVTLGWAGDTPELSSMASIEFADGTEWTTPFTEPEFDISVTDTTAELSTVLVPAGAAGDSEAMTASVVCNS